MSDERERGDIVTEMAQKPKVGLKYPHYIPLSVRKEQVHIHIIYIHMFLDRKRVRDNTNRRR